MLRKEPNMHTVGTRSRVIRRMQVQRIPARTERYQSIQTSRLLADAGWLKWNSCCTEEQKKKRRNRMKMSLFVVCLIGTGFFALSTASRAAPFGGGFHRSVQAGRMGGFVGGGRR